MSVTFSGVTEHCQRLTPRDRRSAPYNEENTQNSIHYKLRGATTSGEVQNRVEADRQRPKHHSHLVCLYSSEAILQRCETKHAKNAAKCPECHMGSNSSFTKAKSTRSNGCEGEQRIPDPISSDVLNAGKGSICSQGE